MATVKPLYDALLVQDDDSFTENAFNYRDTFRFMTQRRMERQFKGVYPGPSKIMSALGQLVWIYAVIVLLVAGASVSSSKQVVVRSAVTVIGSLIVVLIIAQQLRSRLLLLMAYCAVAAHATFLVVAGDPGLFELARPSSDRPKKPGQYTALILLAAIETTILVVYLAIYYAYPALIAREWVDLNKWYEVKRGKRANTLTYRTATTHKGWALRKQFVVQYTGGLDAEFRPHGFGVWKDTAYHGETLVGAWGHGIPIGPFTSREHGSGYASQQLRVAYASYRAETMPDEMDFNPAFPADKQLRWGVARMECSVAGGFFKFLPRVDYFFNRENAPRSAQDCVSILRTPLDHVFYRDTETKPHDEHEKIVRASAASGLNFRESFQLTTPAPVVTEKSEDKTEALVLVHGIYNSLEDSIKLCGQLLARGDFPSEIHPFVFSWPSGNLPVPCYWAAKRNAESPELASALHQFVASILDAGYKKVNFVTHSMGALVFLSTIERKTFRDLFQNSYATSATAAKIGSVTLCSPEFPLARFVAQGGTYDVLREFCPIITIYGDRWDSALRLSEFANRGMNLCGGPVKSLGCRVDSVVLDVAATKGMVCMYPNEFDLTAKVSTPTTIADVNRAAGFRNVARFAQSDPPPSSGSLHSLDDIPVCELQPASELSPTQSPSCNYGSVLDYDNDAGDKQDAQPRVYLDVDVINTSFTDTNVGNRHSYFRVNESIVEDIRDLVLNKRRARGRAGLMREEGNTFIFITAPKDVM